MSADQEFREQIFQFAARDGCISRRDLYPIGTSLLEGINNKITVIKRTAYGFHDDTCFSLKVMKAADPSRRT